MTSLEPITARLRLIADLAACPLCVIRPGIDAFLCAPHADRLDELLPEPCSDPDCYACTGGAR